MYYGLDYGHGKTNIDTRNGIRFGVINAHELGQSWHDEAEADYGVPTCPKCGSILKDGESADYFCESCEYSCSSDETFCDDPLVGYTYVYIF